VGHEVTKPGDLRQREPRVHDEGFLAFVRKQPCCVSGAIKVDAAHIRMACPERGKRASGLHEKPDDRWCVPLSRAEHMNQHAQGSEPALTERAYWTRVGVDPFEVAERLYAEYRAGKPERETPPRKSRKPRTIKRPAGPKRKIGGRASFPKRKTVWPKRKVQSWPRR